MLIIQIGHNHKHDGSSFLIDRPDGTGTWLLLLVKTPASYRIGNTYHRFSEMSFIIYTPDFPEYYFTECAEYCDDWIHFFPSQEEEQLLKELHLPTNVPFQANTLSDASGIVLKMYNEHQAKKEFGKERIDLFFRVLLYMLAEKHNNPEETDYSRTSGLLNDNSSHKMELSRIRDTIYQYPGKQWKIDDMARELGISRSRFQHIYTETFGISIIKDIIRSRVDKAVQFLVNSDLSLKEIGIQIGYRSTPYFSKQFREIMGVPPEKYRKLKKGRTDIKTLK